MVFEKYAQFHGKSTEPNSRLSWTLLQGVM